MLCRACSMPVGPSIFRVMTDRPWGAWRGQAGPPSAPSIGRLGHPGPHDVPTLQLPFFRRSAEAWGKHSSQMHRCSSGRQRTSGRKRVSERKQHRTPSAVANLFDKKELFERSAAGALRVPSHITERNQPPAPRPTAALLSRHPNTTHLPDTPGRSFTSANPCNKFARALQCEAFHLQTCCLVPAASAGCEHRL